MALDEQKFLELLVGALVDYPDHVHIERTTDERGEVLLLQVHADDMGKVIGRAGLCAQALRTILRAAGMKNGVKVNLKILEPMTSGQATMREAMKDVHDAVSAL